MGDETRRVKIMKREKLCSCWDTIYLCLEKIESWFWV